VIDFRTCDQLIDEIAAGIGDTIGPRSLREQLYILEALEDVVANLQYDTHEQWGKRYTTPPPDTLTRIS